MARSREIVSAMLIGSALLAITWQGPTELRTFRIRLQDTLASAAIGATNRDIAAGASVDSNRATQASPAQMLESMRIGILRLALRLLPFMAILCATVIASHWLQTGPMWLPQRIVPDPQRLNPMQATQRLSPTFALTNVALGALKLTCLGVAATWFLRREYESVFALARVPVENVLPVAAPLMFRFTAHLLAGYLVFSLFDVWAAQARNEADLRMTESERRDEIKAVQNDLREFRRR